jgi:RHS repeat-associated protein
MRDADGHIYLHDSNYNVTAVMDRTGGSVVERYAYSPHGEVDVLEADFTQDSDGQSDIGNEILYTGRRLDPETGLQLNRNRFYASHLGPWLSRDPILYLAGSRNLYEYVGGAPTLFEDPFGLKRWPAKNPFPKHSDESDQFSDGCIGLGCLRIGIPGRNPWEAPGTKCFSTLAAAQQELDDQQQKDASACPCRFALQSKQKEFPSDDEGNVDPKDCNTWGTTFNVCTYHEPEDGDQPPYWEWMVHGAKLGPPGNIFHIPEPPKDFPNETYCVAPNCKTPSKRPSPEGPWQTRPPTVLPGLGYYHPGEYSDNPSDDPLLRLIQ